MLNEFKTFIAKGNVVDLAVGIITGGIDFSNLFINLGSGDYTSLAAAKDAGAPVFAYGSFITAVINFLIIAWVVFLLVKAVNKLKATTARKEAEVAAAAPAGPSELDVLLEIRDALKK